MLFGYLSSICSRMVRLSTRKLLGSGFPSCFAALQACQQPLLTSPLPLFRTGTAAKTPQQANPVVFFVQRHWQSLDPLRRARGALAAKNYQSVSLLYPLLYILSLKLLEESLLTSR